MPTFAIVLLVILAWLAMTAWNHRRLNRACYAAFAQVYSNSVPSPTFEPSSSYGYPHFKVTFETKPAMEAADRAGLNQFCNPGPYLEPDAGGCAKLYCEAGEPALGLWPEESLDASAAFRLYRSLSQSTSTPFCRMLPDGRAAEFALCSWDGD